MSDFPVLRRAVNMLAAARTLDEIKEVRNAMMTFESYAHAEKLGDEAERYAREIRVRAARRAGEVLAEMRVNGARATGGTAPESPRGHSGLPTLADLNVTPRQAQTWQALARVPGEDFERQVSEGRGEIAIAEGGIRPRSGPHHPKPKIVTPKTKTNGYTLKQSLSGLQNAAIQVQALAEALDGNLLGDWSRLYDLDEAQESFAVIEESLPVLVARLKRALRDWKERAA